ncbi:MAG TPA: TlpA disulfide reductase family protein, partial [Metalysinibacillus sp.]
EILAVNLTSEEKGNRLVEKFLQSYGITFPVPMDEKGDIALKYQVITIPSTFILNTEGQIEHSIIGPMNEDLLETYVEGIN